MVNSKEDPFAIPGNWTNSPSVFLPAPSAIFDAIDTDNSGSLEKEEVETFVKGLLKGIHHGDDEERTDL